MCECSPIDAEDKGVLASPHLGRCTVTVDVRPTPAEATTSRIPNMKDMLIAYSTIPRESIKYFDIRLEENQNHQ